MLVAKVGGCVRDALLGITPKDIDYVVVGSSPQEMLQQGYKQVGSGFPVFLRPLTGEEYALARRETKAGEGYTGFSYEYAEVTLEEDLLRRDLTINAMALTPAGLVDPYGGQCDLENKILRHTSEAFSEDPVRVLRVARFLARFGQEWAVAPETYALCQKVAWQEFDTLTPERVWLEVCKALQEPHPHLFFEFLYMLDFVWLKEVFAMVGIPQPLKHHPENCTFTHVMMCLQQAVQLEATAEERFAVLCHDFGKPLCWNTRRNLHGHEETGLQAVEDFCDRLKVPTSYRKQALAVCKWHQYGHKILDVQPKKVYKLFYGLKCLRDTKALESFLTCNIADARGRKGFSDREYPQADYLRECLAAAQQVDTKAIANEAKLAGAFGEAVGERIRVAQINAIRHVKNSRRHK